MAINSARQDNKLDMQYSLDIPATPEVIQSLCGININQLTI